MLLDLNRTRPYYRTIAILLYLVSTWLVFTLLAGLLGHWSWGAAGAGLWLAAPGLAAMSIQIRPDVALTIFSFLVVYLVARAVDQRDAPRLWLAAFLLGVAVTVKMHAGGLLVPLAIGAATLDRPAAWPALRRTAVTVLRRYRRTFVVLAIVWLALLIPFNAGNVPFRPTSAQTAVVAGGLGLLVAYTLVSVLAAHTHAPRLVRELANPGHAVVAWLVALGLAVPVSIVAKDGVQALVEVALGLTGQGINSGSSLPTHFGGFDAFPLGGTVIVFALALAAAYVAIRRRVLVPLLWVSGMLVLGLMAAGRLGTPHYFAPAYLLAIPPALWLLRSSGKISTPAYVWPVVVAVVLPTFWHAAAAPLPSLRCLDRGASVARHSLRTGEIALTEPGTPLNDVAFYEFVEKWDRYSARFAYHFLPATSEALAFARARGLRPTLYVGPQAYHVNRAPGSRGDGVGTARLGTAGAFRVRPVYVPVACRTQAGVVAILGPAGSP